MLAGQLTSAKVTALLPLLQVSAAGGGPLVSRLLRAVVGFLEEGGLEARTAGKRMLWELRRLLDSGSSGGGDDFRRALARLDCKQDRASKALLVLWVASRHVWGAVQLSTINLDISLTTAL
jgi:hypothetical protein